MKIFRIIAALTFCIVFCNPTTLAQNRDSLYFFIDAPVFEYPFNTDSKYSVVSMDQTIKATKSFYYATHFGIELLGRKHLGKNGNFWSKVIMSVFDFAPLPLSNTWLHEEFHRAPLALFDIDSKNTHWSNSVKGVKDEDLVRLKNESPADMVRAATAGNEGNLEYVFSMQKDAFFGEVNTWNYGLYWGNYLVNSFYYFGSTREGSKPLVKFKNSENENILKRDANGYDPINATYDLFNPSTPYSARGIHPSGVGIDRYVEFNDLSPDAQQFLKNQLALSFLNFADLNLFGIDQIGKNTTFNFSLRHHLTSFGSMVSGSVLFKNEKFGGIISPKIYANDDQLLPGIDIELRNKWGMLKVAGWQQPENQLYFDTEKKLGGLIELSIAPPLKKVAPYLDLSWKSAGWVAGNPYLNNNFTMRIGTKIKFDNY